VPGLILVLVSWLGALIIFSQEPIKQQMKDISRQAIQKQLEKKNASKEQIDKTMEVAEKYGSIGTMAVSFFIPIIGGFVVPLIWGLIIWVVGAKILGGDFPYFKAVEAVGLVTMIGVLDAVVRTLLVVAMANVFVSPGLMLLIKDWDPQNKVHALLAHVSVFTIWILAIRAIGLGRLSNVSFGRAALWVFGIWAGYTLLFFGVGLAIQQAVSKFQGG
jgi:hypothetical protein